MIELEGQAAESQVMPIADRKAGALELLDGLMKEDAKGTPDAPQQDSAEEIDFGAQEVTEEVSIAPSDKEVEAQKEEAPKEKQYDLLGKIKKKEGAFLKEKSKLQSEISQLKAQVALLAKEKATIQEIETDPAGFFAKKGKFADAYEAMTDYATGKPGSPIVDDLEARLRNEIESERRARKAIESKLATADQAKALADYKASLSSTANRADYTDVRDFYAEMGSGATLESAAYAYADAYARQFAEVISPEAAIETISTVARNSIKAASSLLSKKTKAPNNTKASKEPSTISSGSAVKKGTARPMSFAEKKAAILDQLARKGFE